MDLINGTFYALSSFFRGGKDQFTQTNYQASTNYLYGVGKSAQWVDVSIRNLWDLYNTTPQLKAVFDRKASMFSNGVWKHYKGSFDDLENAELIEDSEIVRMLENPNALQNGNEFLMNDSISYDVYGNSIVYQLKGFSRQEIPSALWVLPAGQMKVKRSGMIYKQTDINDIIEMYQLEVADGGNENFDPNEVIHFRRMNSEDPILGVSVMESLTMPISNIRGAYGFRNRIIHHDGALGFMSSDAKDGLGVSFDDKEQKRFNDAKKAMFGMQDGKSDVLFTEANMKWNPMTFPTKDLMLFEEVNDDFKIIIDAVGLNDNIFSLQKAQTFSNLRDGIRMAYQDCIFPFAENRSLAYTKAFGLDQKGEFVKLDYSHLEILKKDEKEKSEAESNKAKAILDKAKAVQLLTDAGLNDVASEIEF